MDQPRFVHGFRNQPLSGGAAEFLAMPPHRYHSSRRIEHAKILLAKPASSVTDVGWTVGFTETSSFTAAFRKATGLTPTAYRRSLA